MRGFQLWAQPWWVNLLLLVPVICFLGWRRKRLSLDWRRLLLLAIFGAAFGFVEAAVVVYLRAASNFASYSAFPSALGSPSTVYRQTLVLLAQYPQALLRVEAAREAATMIMLVVVAVLAAQRLKERWAAFLWVFAVWDLTYYAGLRATLCWPTALTDFDVLFLLPVPWLSQIWFPILVSSLTLAAVALAAKQEERSQTPKSWPNPDIPH